MKCPSFSFLSWLRAVKRFAPNDIPISAKRFFILSRLIFSSLPKEMKRG